jgi:rod shape-determining protein MreC
MATLLMLGNSSNYFLYVRNKSTNILHNIIYKADATTSKLSHLYQNIKDLVFIYDKNIELKQHNSLLKYEIQRLRALEFENRELKKQVNLVENGDFKYVSARVITNVIGPYNYYATILAGEQNGLKEGQVVINNQGLVGKIIQVFDKTASVLLVTDLNSKVPIVTSKFLEKAIISGSNENKLRLLYLNDTKKVEIGEVVVTNDNGEFFPTGIPVATIESISENYISAKPVVDITKLDYVKILVK